MRAGERLPIVRVGLGVLLVAAAGLKLYGLGVSALPRVGWFAQPWVQLAAAECELVLGLWLISGSAPRWSWLAALVTFASFAAVSGYLGYIGVASCGCFGVIEASPWWAFGVDVGAVGLLLVSLPLGGCASHPREHRVACNSVTWVAVVVVLFVGVTVPPRVRRPLRDVPLLVASQRRGELLDGGWLGAVHFIFRECVDAGAGDARGG